MFYLTNITGNWTLTKNGERVLYNTLYGANARASVENKKWSHMFERYPHMKAVVCRF